MRKLLLIIVCFLYLTDIRAQQIFTDYLRYYNLGSVSSKQTLPGFAAANGEYSLMSSGITNRFFLDFVNGSYIDNAQKEYIYERLSDVSRFGYQLNLSVAGAAAVSRSARVIAAISASQRNSAVFSKDMFYLFFRGNKPFAGKTADLDPFRFTSYSYQTFSAGINKSIADNRLNFWAGLSLVRGGNFRYAETERLKLFTEQYGAYIEADADIKARVSAGKPGLIADKNGMGASFFGGFDYQIGKSTVGFSVTDLGFIQWNKMKTYKADGLLRFEGKEIPNILGFSDTLLSSYSADSLAAEVGVDIYEENFFYRIPTFIKLTYVYKHSETWMFISGVELVTGVGTIPRVFLKPVVALTDNFYIQGCFMYGGFGRMNLELGAAAHFGRQISGYMNLNAAGLLLAANKTGGQGLSLGIYKCF